MNSVATQQTHSSSLKEKGKLCGSHFYGDSVLDYADAKAFCASWNSTLISIHSEQEFDFYQTLCSNLNPTASCWTGLFLDKYSKSWKFADGTSVDYGFVDEVPTKGIKPWALQSLDHHHHHYHHSDHIFIVFDQNQNYLFERNGESITAYPICNGICTMEKKDHTYIYGQLAQPVDSNESGDGTLDVYILYVAIAVVFCCGVCTGLVSWSYRHYKCCKESESSLSEYDSVSFEVGLEGMGERDY